MDSTDTVFVVRAHSSGSEHHWGPFTSADDASNWAIAHFHIGRSYWEIVPVIPPALVDDD